MKLLELLKAGAIRRGFLDPETKMDAATAFALVRDILYSRATSREPEATIREWRGTCSGKHYLLHALFAELGLRSRVMACSTETTIETDSVPAELIPVLEEANWRIVDVHNYLVVELPAGDMIVDATWPLTTEKWGVTVNNAFQFGQNQTLACTPVQIWVVPADQDPQQFKKMLLKQLFTSEQLTLRERFIRILSRVLAERAGDEA